MSGAVTQSGAVVSAHVAAWQANGSVRDGGYAGSGNLTDVGITNNGSLALGINSGAITAAYSQFGVTVASGTVTVSVGSFNGAPAAALYYDINGTLYPFNPAGSGNITGPGTVVSGDLVSFNGTAGNVVQDSGVPAGSVVQGPTAVVSGNLASFNGTTGKLIQDSGVVASALAQGPGSAVSGHVLTFNGTTGKVFQDGGFSVNAALWPFVEASSTGAALALLFAAPGASQTLAGALTVTGGVTLSATGTALAVTNNGTIGGTLGVAGLASFTGAGTSIQTTANASIGGALAVTAGASVGGALTVGTTLGVTGAASVGGQLTVPAGTASGSAVNLSQSLAGATVVDKTSTNVIGTVYTNTTPRTRYVTIYGSGPSGSGWYSVLGGINGGASQGFTTGAWVQNSLVVPPGVSYEFTVGPAGVLPTLAKWLETA
jgi:hypothetical protein